MTNQFWRTPSEWPNDPPGYCFLARAFDEIARAMFGTKWSLEEPTDDELNAIDLDADDEDKAGDAHHRMWAAVKVEISKQCLAGKLVSAVRPKEGGPIIDLSTDMWNAENLERRFCRCQMSVEVPFADSQFPDTHWIFLSRKSLDKYLVGQPHGALATQAPKYISPYLKTMLVVTERMGITPDRQPKKKEVIAEIQKAWTGVPLSKKLIEVMATLIRERESQLGRAKKKNIE